MSTAFLTSCTSDTGAESIPTSTNIDIQEKTVDEAAAQGLKEACELHVDLQSKYVSAINGLQLGEVSDADLSALKLEIIEEWVNASNTFDDDISEFFDRMVHAVETESFENGTELETARIGLQANCAGAGYPTEITSQYGG